MGIFRLTKKYIALQKKDIGIMVSTTLLLWVATMLTPYITAVFLDSLILQAYASIVWRTVIILSIIWTLQLLFTYTRNIVSTRVHSLTGYYMRYDLVAHIKRLPISYFREIDSAYLNQRTAMDTGTVVGFVLGSVLGLFTTTLTFVVALVILFNLNYVVAFIICLLLPVYTLIYIKFKNPLYEIGKKMAEEASVFHGLVNKQISNICLIKQNEWQSRTGDEMNTGFYSLFKTIMQNARLSYLVNNADSVVRYLANIAIFVYSGLQIIVGRMTIGQFTMINTYSLMVVSCLSVFFNFGKSYQQASVAYDRAMEILNTVQEKTGTIRLQGINRIKVADLCFNHQNKQIINTISFEMEKGKIYAITGDNGTGKSTFVNILCGIEQNYGGALLVMESRSDSWVNMREVELCHYREKLLAIVPQEPVLYYDTIFENISEGRNESIVDTWLEILSLSDFIKCLPDGLATKVTEKSANFSGGEKQLLAVAKAFIKNADIMILDEPSSALDAYSIELMYKALADVRDEKIVLIVTHDKGLVDLCDEEIVFL